MDFASLSLEQVIASLNRAMATMKKGERAILTINPDFGFGSSEVRWDLAVIPPSTNVVYEVEVLDFLKVTIILNKL
jgi:FK506-binding protein 4/5